MSDQRRLSDHEMDQLIGRLLQLGVLLAALVTLVGGVMLLAHHGSATPSFTTFRGEPDHLTSLGGIVRGLRELRSDAVVQLGIVLLIATPIARVAFTLVAFMVQRDRTYVLITLVVLVLLLYGLIYGRA